MRLMAKVSFFETRFTRRSKMGAAERAKPDKDH